MNLENLQNSHLRLVSDASAIKRLRPPVTLRGSNAASPSKTIPENYSDLDCLKIQAVAKIMDVSADTIRRLIKRGKLKAVKVGKNVRVCRWSIDEYMRTNEIEPENQTEEKTPRHRTSNGAGYRAALKKAQELGISI